MKKAPSLALGNFFKTKKQILKADIHKLIKTNQTNYVDPKYGTALNRAIKLKDEQIIAELLARKVDIDKAIYFAIGHEYTLEEIKTLISLSPAELPDEYLYKSVHKGRLDLVKYFIEEKGFDVNTTINNPVHGGAILSIATMEEHTKVIDYLLKKGATPSQGVISAIIKGNVKILKKLFEYGATAHDGYSEDLVALLVNAAIPANDPTCCKSSDSETKEDLSNYVEILKFLLEHGGNPNAEILERGTVILIALSALMDEPENVIYKNICKLLIQHGADTSKFKSYTKTITMLKKEMGLEAKVIDNDDFKDEGYISDSADANQPSKKGSKLVDTSSNVSNGSKMIQSNG
ncbi:MAG TPA: ankyrin repeat domain-containing protein [Rickettsia endosymbiont of Diachasma alloeum]|nr:ankyrin repeat domain-containing protein [Rickettsia endosymbiont of Diachasma alloeum]